VVRAGLVQLEEREVLVLRVSPVRQVLVVEQEAQAGSAVRGARAVLALQGRLVQPGRRGLVAGREGPEEQEQRGHPGRLVQLAGQVELVPPG
jgi:hypothetical protein